MKTAANTFTTVTSRKATASYLDKPAQFVQLPHPLIEVVVPVLNEEKILKQSITTLNTFLRKNSPYDYHITIADNGSTDNTQRIAAVLAKQLRTVSLHTLPQRGRGRALKQVWQTSKADILTYMDVDLSTGLEAFLPMIEPLVSGHAGVAIGSRLMRGAQTTRGLKREVISRVYNKIIKFSAHTKFSDAQCGFKAIRKDVALRLLPSIKDNEWFFDTELLIKAERGSIRIHEQPVTWIEDTDSRVHLTKTATDDIKGLIRISKEYSEPTILQRLSLPLILIASGALYLFGALHNGMANSYYSAAVQAASQNWTAWLFGSLDAANYVSVDKPPVATMIMGLFARIFGFSSLSMLLPNVLAAVGAAWLVHNAVRRQFGATSGLIAAGIMALTPSVALMAGFNNPDMILTFFLAASAYAFLRSLEQKKPLLWLGLAGLFTGLAFNTKMLQGLMVLPAMGLVYLVFAKPPIVTRIVHLVFAGVITTVSTLWWSVLVWITPAANHPWVGSTTDNNIWSLIFGYNGFGRLFGNSAGQGGGGTGGPGGMGQTLNTTSGAAASFSPPAAGGMGGGGGMSGPGSTGFGGSTGIFRMFNSDFGPNIAWLLPAALIGGGIMLWLLRKTPRSNRGRAAVIFWLLWLLIHVVIFSMTSGVIHPYYVVVMAPAIAALIGISTPFIVTAYKRRKQIGLFAPAIVAVTTIVAMIILSYGSFAWLGWLLLPIGLLASILLLMNFYQATLSLAIIGTTASVIALGLAPGIYTIATVTTTHSGSIPTAGPTATAMAGSNNESATISDALKTYLIEHQGSATWIAATASANESAPIQLSTGQPVMAIGGFNGSDTPLTLAEFKALVASGKVKYYVTSSTGMGRGGMASNSDITSWVTANSTVVDYGGSDVTLYALSA